MLSVAATMIFIFAGPTALAMPIVVRGLSHSSTTFNTLVATTPHRAAAGDGILHYSVRGDFDRSNQHGDTGPNPADERNLTFDLDGFSFNVAFDHHLNHSRVISGGSPVFGEDSVDGIFVISKNFLDVILADGVIHFNYGFDASNGMNAHGIRQSAALIFTPAAIAAVPEPTTFALLTCGAAAALTAGRRRWSQSTDRRSV